MEKITSTSNEIVKSVSKLSQKKYRDENELFIAEGYKAIKGLLSAGFEIISLFSQKEDVDILAEKKYLVNEAVMSKISTTKSPCEVLAVLKQKKYDKQDLLNRKKILLLENIKDSGNLGTIIRDCKAFDMEAVILLGDTIDLYNPKVIRASVGCFDLPVVNLDYDELGIFKHHKIYSTALYKDSVSLKEITFKEPYILAFGSEAEGLTEKFLSVGTTNFNIEMNKSVESLNLASAVAVCLYKAYSGD